MTPDRAVRGVSLGAIPSKIAPVFLRDVGVDFDRPGAFRIEAIPAIFSRTRNPEPFSGLDVEMVCLLPTTLQALEGAPSIADRFARLRKCDTANLRRSVERRGFVFNIHDARFRHA